MCCLTIEINSGFTLLNYFNIWTYYAIYDVENPDSSSMTTNSHNANNQEQSWSKKIEVISFFVFGCIDLRVLIIRLSVSSEGSWQHLFWPGLFICLQSWPDAVYSLNLWNRLDNMYIVPRRIALISVCSALTLLFDDCQSTTGRLKKQHCSQTQRIIEFWWHNCLVSEECQQCASFWLRLNTFKGFARCSTLLKHGLSI